MANVTYTSLHAVTQQNKATAYALLTDLIAHLPNLGIDLIDLSINAQSHVVVVLTGRIRADHAGFWDLDGGV